MSKKKIMTKQKLICIILVCVLSAGLITIPLLPESATDSIGQQTSDYFFAQIYDTENNVISKYKITLTGIFSQRSSEITSISFNLESGDVCETSYVIDGNKVTVIISHPTEGYWGYNFILSTNGVFSGY